MGATRNPERWTVNVVIAEQKVRMVKNIEGFNSKLQMKSFRDSDVLEKRSVESPVGGSDKRIPTKVPHAAQTWRVKEVAGQVESVGPLRVRGMNVIRDCTWTVIVFAVKVVVAT